jgi:hypothetical protein
MKVWNLLGFLIVVVSIVSTGCKKNDEADIQALLEDSWFVCDGEVQTADDSTATPSSVSAPWIAADTFPFFTPWVRWIQRPVSHEFDIVINGDSANVTITAYFQGTPPGYGFFVINDTAGPVLNRAISDTVIRKVKCYRDDSGWHIAGLTVADMYTVSTTHPVTIAKVTACVTARNYTFVVNSAETYFAKDELPTFYPGDTVLVTVTCSAEGDSTWAFLHHGAGHRPGYGLKHHWRQPFFRDNSTNFSRTWVIADDSVITTPAVRHSAIDVLGWQTLFGDSTATYYSHAWGIPYIIKDPADETPNDLPD